MKKNYFAIGVMSGSSLDGIDLALCSFSQKENQWNYQVHKVDTIEYSSSERILLNKAPFLSGYELTAADKRLGTRIGKGINAFLEGINTPIDFISSHGHTIFHNPEESLTLQIGHGACIAAQTNRPVVCDLRSMDMAYSGQGAPLVPVGEKYLFQEHQIFLNLGGISNISFHKKDKVVAFDICPCNIVLNQLANEASQDFDNEGRLAEKGEINHQLLSKMNAIDYFQKEYPKSTDREWTKQHIFPLILDNTISLSDRLRTYTEFIAHQVAKSCEILKEKNTQKTIFCTGGGAFNTFLMQLLQEKLYPLKVIVPNQETVAYKEAIIFAFLGLLRWLKVPNIEASVTGAKKNTVGGAIYWA